MESGSDALTSAMVARLVRVLPIRTCAGYHSPVDAVSPDGELSFEGRMVERDMVDASKRELRRLELRAQSKAAQRGYRSSQDSPLHRRSMEDPP